MSKQRFSLTRRAPGKHVSVAHFPLREAGVKVMNPPLRIWRDPDKANDIRAMGYRGEANALRQEFVMEQPAGGEAKEAKRWRGLVEGANRAASYVLLVGGMEDDGFAVIPVDSWYNFRKENKYRAPTIEEAEELMKRQRNAPASDRFALQSMREKAVKARAATEASDRSMAARRRAMATGSSRRGAGGWGTFDEWEDDDGGDGGDVFGGPGGFEDDLLGGGEKIVYDSDEEAARNKRRDNASIRRGDKSHIYQLEHGGGTGLEGDLDYDFAAESDEDVVDLRYARLQGGNPEIDASDDEEDIYEIEFGAEPDPLAEPATKTATNPAGGTGGGDGSGETKAGGEGGGGSNGDAAAAVEGEEEEEEFKVADLDAMIGRKRGHSAASLSDSEDDGANDAVAGGERPAKRVKQEKKQQKDDGGPAVSVQIKDDRIDNLAPVYRASGDGDGNPAALISAEEVRQAVLQFGAECTKKRILRKFKARLKANVANKEVSA